MWNPAARFCLWLQNQIWCSCCEAAGLTIPFLVLFTSGSILHRHLPLPLRYTASFAHTWSDPAWGARWHNFLPLSWYLPPFWSTGKNKTKNKKHAFMNIWHYSHTQRHTHTHTKTNKHMCGWMLVLRFSSPMQLVWDFLPLLEVTTPIKMTVTGKHSILWTFPKVLLIHSFDRVIYWFLCALQGLFLPLLTEQCHQHCRGLRHFFCTEFYDLWARGEYFRGSWIRQVLSKSDC